MQELARKTAFVTGAAGGFGLVLAEALLAEDMLVVLADISDERIRAAATRLDPGGGNTLALACDVTRRDSLAEAAAAAVARFGPPALQQRRGAGAGASVLHRPI